MTIHVAARTTRSTQSTGWWVPFALVALVLIPATLGAGWAINLAVAEYAIRRHGSRRTASRRTISRRTGSTVEVGSS